MTLLRAPAILLVLLGALLSSCASTRQHALPVGLQGLEPRARYEPYLDAMRREGERNAVLHLERLAVAAMKAGDRTLAERALDEAILRINDVFALTPEARKARTIFFEEDVKLFKGEPYERVMAFFYRAVLYMQEGDWQNARASLRSAVLQDAFAEEQQFKADWTILDYLIAVCEYQLNRPFYAEEALDRARESYRQFREQAHGILHGGQLFHHEPKLHWEQESEVLVVVQEGRGPEKVRKGRYQQYLGFDQRTRRPPASEIQLDRRGWQRPRLMDALFYQATTRGGRPFDVLQGRKVLFKQSVQTLGEAGQATGLAVWTLANSRGERNAGAAIFVAGLLVEGLANAASTRADIRQWGQLPEYIALYSGQWTQRGPRTIHWRDGAGGQHTLSLPGENEDSLTVVLAFPGPEGGLLGPQ